MRSAISSSAITPKPTGTTRFVCASNSTRAGTGASRKAQPGGAPVVGHRFRPALQRLAGERDGEHVEAVALGEGPQQRPEHLAARAAGVAEIDQPVALPDPGERGVAGIAAFVRPDLLGERADRTAQRVVELGRRPHRAPEGVGEGGGALQRLLLEAQIGGDVLRRRRGRGSPRRGLPPAPGASPRCVPSRIARCRESEPAGPGRVRPVAAPPPGGRSRSASRARRRHLPRHTRTAIPRRPRARPGPTRRASRQGPV